MKRKIACLLVGVVLFGCVTACSSSQYVSLHSDSTGTSARDTELSATTEQSSTIEVTKASGTEWEPSVAEEAAALSSIREAIAQDQLLIDLFINLTYDGQDLISHQTSEANPDGTYSPIEVSEFANFSTIEQLLWGTYSHQKASDFFMQYPPFGEKQIINESGKTMVFSHYSAGFLPKIDLESLEIRLLTSRTGVIHYSILDSEWLAADSQNIFLVNNKWCLEESFYTVYMRTLNTWEEENPIPWEDSEYVDEVMNNGSAKRFIGDSLVVNVFLSDTATSWNDTALEEYFRIQDIAYQYLEEKAAEYGQDLQITGTDTTDSLFLTYDSVIPDDLSYYWAYSVFAQNDLISMKDHYQSELADLPYDSISYNFVLNKPGRSFALPSYAVYEGDYETRITDDDPEFMVLFFDEDPDDDYNSYFLTSSTIAHELMHVYGAQDYYYPWDGEDIRKELILTYFPYELMLFVPTDVYDAQISALVAYEVGWRESLPEQLVFFHAKG